MKRIILFFAFVSLITRAVAQTYREGNIPVGDDYLICNKGKYSSYYLQDKDYPRNSEAALKEQQRITEGGKHQGNMNYIVDRLFYRSNDAILKAFREVFTEEELKLLAEDKYMSIIAVFNSKGDIVSTSIILGVDNKRITFSPDRYYQLFLSFKNNVKISLPADPPSFISLPMNLNLVNISNNGFALPETYFRKRSWVK